MSVPRLAQVADATPPGVRASRPPVPKRRKGLPIAVLLAGSLVAMVAVGAIAFVVVRTVGAGGAAPQAPTTTPITPRATAPTPLELAIVSEPLGATVHVDGEAVEGGTPVTVTLPPGTDRVWVRVSKEGYESLEREVLATVGESRFVLRTIE